MQNKKVQQDDYPLSETNASIYSSSLRPARPAARRAGPHPCTGRAFPRPRGPGTLGTQGVPRSPSPGTAGPRREGLM